MRALVPVSTRAPSTTGLAMPMVVRVGLDDEFVVDAREYFDVVETDMLTRHAGDVAAAATGLFEDGGDLAKALAELLGEVFRGRSVGVPFGAA